MYSNGQIVRIPLGIQKRMVLASIVSNGIRRYLFNIASDPKMNAHVWYSEAQLDAVNVRPLVVISEAHPEGTSAMRAPLTIKLEPEQAKAVSSAIAVEILVMTSDRPLTCPDTYGHIKVVEPCRAIVVWEPLMEWRLRPALAITLYHEALRAA